MVGASDGWSDAEEHAAHSTMKERISHAPATRAPRSCAAPLGSPLSHRAHGYTGRVLT